MKGLIINHNLSHKQAQQRKKAEAKVLRKETAAQQMVIDAQAKRESEEKAQLEAEKRLEEQKQRKAQAQRDVAVARRLKRADEPRVNPNATNNINPLSLDAFEDKYKPKIEPSFQKPPSRWTAITEKFNLRTAQLLNYLHSSISSFIESTGKFFTTLKEKYNTWTYKQAEIEKNTQEDIPPIIVPENIIKTSSEVSNTTNLAPPQIIIRQSPHLKRRAYREPGTPIVKQPLFVR